MILSIKKIDAENQQNPMELSDLCKTDNSCTINYDSTNSRNERPTDVKSLQNLSENKKQADRSPICSQIIKEMPGKAALPLKKHS